MAHHGIWEKAPMIPSSPSLKSLLKKATMISAGL
jgi:hypothetical protein